MAIETGARVQLNYITETTFGTTPATPQTIALPKSTMTFDYNVEAIEDPTLTGDRMGTSTVRGNYSTAGDITATLRHSQFDPLFEMAMGGTWTANVLDNGSVNRSITLEQWLPTISRGRVFTGVRVNGFNLEVAQGQIVNTTFSFMGTDMVTTSALLDTTPTAIQNKRGMNHIGGSISIGGSSVVATAMSLNVTNNMEGAYAIGTGEAFDVVWGDISVTGSVTLYVDSFDEYNMFLQDTLFNISVTVTDGTNQMTFSVPAAKFNTAALPVSGQGMLFLTLDFVGEKDPVTNTKARITRTAV